VLYHKDFFLRGDSILNVLLSKITRVPMFVQNTLILKHKLMFAYIVPGVEKRLPIINLGVSMEGVVPQRTILLSILILLVLSELVFHHGDRELRIW
jgi:hypothetical protein